MIYVVTFVNGSKPMAVAITAETPAAAIIKARADLGISESMCPTVTVSEQKTRKDVP